MEYYNVYTLMRYTTLIDIREIPAVWSCLSAKLLYIHLVLAAGFHDDDRDIVNDSFRGLAAKTGLTLSSVRHAVRVLTDSGLLRRQDDLWIVKKWIPVKKISQRPTSAPISEEERQERERIRQKEARKEERARARAEELKATGKTEFMIYYEGLLQKAESGDREAARLVERHRATYEAHKMKNQK